MVGAMKWKSALCAAALLCGCPAAAPDDGRAPQPVSAEEHRATIEALRPTTSRARPLVAIATARSGTETTDLLVPYGVLRRSNAMDVVIVAESLAPLDLMPALRVHPQQTYEAFGSAHEAGADYVIVPAMMDASDRAAQRFIADQRQRGARIVGICSGARVLADAGLLDGRRATAHWADVIELQQAHPTMAWVRDRRYVVDREVMTTTGVSASVPASLAMIEAIAGAAVAQRVADELGARSWLESHDSDAFRLDSSDLSLAAGNILSPWNKERIAIAVTDGVDEVSLALEADAWSRTYRSRGAATTPDGRTITTLGGLAIDTEIAASAQRSAPTAGALALDTALDAIEARYSAATARFVAMQLEYAR